MVISGAIKSYLKEGINYDTIIHINEDIKKDVRIHIMNLNDKTETENLIKTIKPEWIFHLAANGNYSWQNDLDKIIQTNILGTINLVEACLKVGFETFVNTGSSSEYGFKI